MVNIIPILIVAGILFVILLLIYLSLVETRDISAPIDRNELSKDKDLAERELELEVNRVQARTRTFGPG